MIKKIAFLLLFLIVAFFFSLKWGATTLSWSGLFGLFQANEQNSQLQLLLFSLRIPRTFAALYVGAALGLSGAVLQSLLRNPLADSYTLGLSGGSSLGAVLTLYFGFYPIYFWVPLFSTLGTFCSLLLLLLLLRFALSSQSRSLILAGSMISLFFSALSVLSLSLLPAEKNQAALAWLMGEFGSSRDSWAIYFILLSLPVFIFIFLKAKDLNALSLGEAKAASLGVSVQKSFRIFIILSSILTASAISLAGLIGFIGLVSPHIARKLFKTSLNQYILPASALIGAILLICSDTLGRALILDREIPAGSLAAVIGAPLLIGLLFKRSYDSVE